VLELATLVGGIASMIALVSPSLPWLYVAFALLGVTVAGTTVGSINVILDLAPLDQRPTYIGLTSTLLAIPTALSPLLGGWLISRWGYSALFNVGGACALVGYALLRWTVTEPRQRQGDGCP
jgi:MFS family permease